MNLIDINPTSPEWLRISAYVNKRRDELLIIMDDLSSTDQARRDAAARRNELAELLAAPTTRVVPLPAKNLTPGY